MASFFQPATGVSYLANDTRFEIYWNGVLSPRELRLHWYQDVIIAVGGTAFLTGLFCLARYYWPSLRWRIGNWIEWLANCFTKSFWKSPSKDGLSRSDGGSIDDGGSSDNICLEKLIPSDNHLKDVKSFVWCTTREMQQFFESDFDMSIITIADKIDVQPQEQRFASTTSLECPSQKSTLNGMEPRDQDPGSLGSSTCFGPEDVQDVEQGKARSKVVLAAVTMEVLSKSSTTTAEKCSVIKKMMHRLEADGCVLCLEANDSPYEMNALLQRLNAERFTVVLAGDPTLPIIDKINFELLSGLVLYNANMHRSGLRKDFFQASRMRESVARCTRQKKTREEFFLGFLEEWDTAPLASVLRRTFKLAEFFGAVLQAQSSNLRRGKRLEKTAMCMSGFDWLKRPEIIELQRKWTNETDVVFEDEDQQVILDVAQISEVVPAAGKAFRLVDLPNELVNLQGEIPLRLAAPDYRSTAPTRQSLWHHTSDGTPLCGYGCFNLREELLQEHYDEILSIQQHLKTLEMLAPFTIEEINQLSTTLGAFQKVSSYPKLVEKLCNSITSKQVLVFRSLDSSLRLPDDGGHFLGISGDCEVDGEPRLDIFISQKASDNIATILHVYLAYHGVSRLKRFEEELHLLRQRTKDDNKALPRSILAELDESSETELLFLVQQISVCDEYHPFMDAMIQRCEELLLEQTTRASWASLHSRACLDRSLSIQDLLERRLRFYAKSGATKLPSLDSLVEFYNQLEWRMADALFACDRPALATLSNALKQAYQTRGQVEPRVDLYGLLFFCALRRLAFEDVYLETTDRCPFFLTQHDQAGVFAELWVLGSQCQIYFGIMPRALGEVIYDRYRDYLAEHPPPLSSWNGKDVFTAYANVMPTVKLEGYGAMTGSGSPDRLPGSATGYRANEPDDTMSLSQRASKLGALSIFCFPAIVDVLLLTFLGRGFYLTAFMADYPRLMANFAILTALIMTGGVTGWVGSTGGFYLFSFAFENLTHFLVQRFSAAFMLTIVVAFCGFFAFGCEYSWFAGFVYVMYLLALTTFLNLLGIFATIHRLDCPLSSGRIKMWKCMSILLISPILTTFVNGWDLLIYLLVIYTFIIVLLITFRNLCQEWTSWQSKVPTAKEKDLFKWYQDKMAKIEGYVAPESSSDMAAEARAALDLAVKSYKPDGILTKLRIKTKPPEDPFVKKMAIGYPFAMWLLKKEAGEEPLPEIYTTTWFVQLELALNNQVQVVRGLKEHSPFITFRYSKYDLGQNVGLFLGALMDRWIAISTSARQPQVVLYYDDRARYAICFGLLYFLAGAVAVDTILQRYWPYATKLSDTKLTGVDDFVNVLRYEKELKIKRYRSAVAELLTLLLIIFGFTTIFLWIFVIDHKAIILYILAITGYTGVLFYQFNRCFAESARTHVIVVFVCCFIGYVVGVLLRVIPSTAGFFYTDAIGLNIATISAALGTFYYTGCFVNPFKRHRPDSFDLPVFTNDATDNTNKRHDRNQSTSLIGQISIATTNKQLLHDLSLGIDVNTAWSHLTLSVRRLIWSRFVGDEGQQDSEASDWLLDHEKDVDRYDQHLLLCLDEYNRCKVFEEVENIPEKPELTSAITRVAPSLNVVQSASDKIIRILYSTVEWTAIVSSGAPDTGRELWFALRAARFRVLLVWIILQIWKLCWEVRNFFIVTVLIKPKGPMKQALDYNRYGMSRSLQGDTIRIDSPFQKLTGFITRDQDSNLVVEVFDGQIESKEGNKPKTVAHYDSKYRLICSDDGSGDEKSLSRTVYQYDQNGKKRWPISKTTGDGFTAYYDNYGRVLRGETTRKNMTFTFEYLYKKRPKGNSDVLRATFTCHTSATPIYYTVYWCVQPRAGSDNISDWTASSKTQRVVATVDDLTYDMKWSYLHPHHPDVDTEIHGSDGTTFVGKAPPHIVRDEYGFYVKPKNVAFEYEDLLVHHSSRNLAGVAREVKKKPFLFLTRTPKAKVVHRKLPTAVLRTFLWTSWGKSKNVDAVTCCFIDEMILRKEKLLSKYWTLRDCGRFDEAADILDKTLDQVVSAIDPTSEATDKCFLQIKASDLFTMGLGKDANQLTTRLQSAYADTPNRTSVVFSDNGCWPDNPGGVSNCRRDLVNGHTTIRGHCLAESANDFGLPRYQIERNVNSLKILPLWGLDGKTPYHGLIDNLLQTQVDERINDTHEKEDISGIFIPLLRTFVRGARARRYTREDLVTYSNVVLQINRYFEHCDFNKTWNYDKVFLAWIEAWLYDYNDPNISNVADYFEIEKPSMTDFREALNLYICYFFIYSVEIPGEGECPSVYQSTHHGISSLYGMILKYRRNACFGIWDHAILWRETCLNISPAQCLLPIPVQAMLLAGVKLSCHLAYTHVDVILPCTSVFNPDWEKDLGTDQGRRGSFKVFSRKIDPIVNGIGNMDSFEPVKEIRSKLPTTIMLSNVQFIKDVKNAVLAADVIINKYGFDKYRLTIYGAQDRQPSYALETTTLITTRNLSGKVVLGGFGSPKEVLKDAWLFQNSSLSEGLPLAIGEAALSGVPIVATEVGATALVLTDPYDSTKRYGEVVPPNDPEALARAQLSILAMLGPWAEYTTDDVPPPPLPDVFTAEDVEWITKRMYDKMEDRRKLGLKLREVVLHSFHGSRYLREHEQMYWLQRKMAEMRRRGKGIGGEDGSGEYVRGGDAHGGDRRCGERIVFGYDRTCEGNSRVRWQDFNVDRLLGREKKLLEA